MGASAGGIAAYTGSKHRIITDINSQTFKNKDGINSYGIGLRFLESAGISKFNLADANSTCVEHHAGVVFVFYNEPIHPREDNTINVYANPYFEQKISIMYERMVDSPIENNTLKKWWNQRGFIKELRNIAKESKLENHIYRINKDDYNTDKTFRGLRVFLDIPFDNCVSAFAKPIADIEELISEHYKKII